MGTVPQLEVVQALALTLDHVGVSIFVTEVGSDSLVFANRNFRNRFGDDCVGRKVSRYLDVPPSLFEGDPDGVLETYCDRTAEWLSVTASDLSWPFGGMVRIFTCRVITARKLLGEVKKDADRVRDSFLDEARSEISVPLKAVCGAADMIMHEYITPQVRNHAFRIKHTATTLLVAINELIDIRKNDSPQPTVSTRLSRHKQDGEESGDGCPLAAVHGLDAALGRENMSGSDTLYRQILAQYCAVSPSIRAQIIKSLGNRDLHGLIIHLHSLKSSTASIGAVALSYRASRLERAGRDADWTTLDGDMGAFLDDWQALVNTVWQALNASRRRSRGTKEGNPATLRGELELFRNALAEFNPNTADKILEKLRRHDWPETIQAGLDSLADDILLSDFEQAESRLGLLLGHV